MTDSAACSCLNVGCAFAALPNAKESQSAFPDKQGSAHFSFKMRTIMDRTPHESSFSFSRRYFNWRKKPEDDDQEANDDEFLESFSLASSGPRQEKADDFKFCVPRESNVMAPSAPKKKLPVMAVTKFWSALSIFGYKNRASDYMSSPPLGTKVIGTLFGHRQGHVHIAFQSDPKSGPAFFVELSTPTGVLVKEMASGLVRVALECDKKGNDRKCNMRLLDEPLWRVFCNGKKCGYATRRDCGSEELIKVLKAVESITMGAGVLPGDVDGTGRKTGKVMYMRAKFERVVGSRDSEALYMMNPDHSGCPEFSVYLLRV
ncbi:hypothetical protein Droror1_Dr00022354 [Drosera rotundifolia]